MVAPRLHPTSAAQGDPAPGSAAEFIVRMAAEHPGQVVVLALAALTNLALALHLDPGLPGKLVRRWRAALYRDAARAGNGCTRRWSLPRSLS